MRIDIEIDTQQFDADARRFLDSSVRPAVSAGLNAAAELVRQELLAELNRDLDAPNPWTQKAFGIMPSMPKPGVDPDAVVFVRDSQAQYLTFQIDGGVRRAGDVGSTKSGLLVPGPDAQLDRYGNLPRGYVAQQLIDPNVHWTTMNQGKGYTALVRNVPDGRPQLLAFIMPEIDYEPRFDFYDTAVRAANKHVPGEVEAAMLAAGLDD